MGVNKKILDLALPSILANITVPLVGMVDIAVAGHLDASSTASAATLIGGVAIGTMLFDLLYWNFGFLRVGTGGLAAQAFGRGDMTESASILSRAVGIALLCSFLLLAVQWIFVKAAFLRLNSVCDAEENSSVSQFFHLLDAVAMPRGAVRADERWDITTYSCCINASKGIYYYKTYENNQLTAVDMHREELESDKVKSYALATRLGIAHAN